MTEEQRTQLPAEPERPSPITPETWCRLLTAFDAGAPTPLACQYAALPYATWLAECERIPEFAIEAGKVSASGPVSALRFVQQAAASEWRGAVEFVKLVRPDLFGTGAARGREVARPGEPGGDELDAEVSLADVATVLRLLGAGGIAGEEGERDVAAEPDGHPNGQHAQPEVGADGDGGRGR